MGRRFFMLAALVAFTAVAIGAFGAHGLRAHFEANPTLAPTFQTASEYHLFGGLALFAAAWAVERYPGRLARWAAWLLLVGVVVFSGSLYILSIANVRIMGAVAPIGGVCLLAGFALLALAAHRHRDG